jgi:hypothetical protein
MLMPFHWRYLLEDGSSSKIGENLDILILSLPHSSFPLLEWHPRILPLFEKFPTSV